MKSDNKATATRHHEINKQSNHITVIKYKAGLSRVTSLLLLLVVACRCYACVTRASMLLEKCDCREGCVVGTASTTASQTGSGNNVPRVAVRSQEAVAVTYTVPYLHTCGKRYLTSSWAAPLFCACIVRCAICAADNGFLC